MRIARLGLEAGPVVGIVAGDAVQPLAGVSVLELLAADPAERDALVARHRDGDAVALAQAQLLAPLEPTTFRDFMTFEEHIEGALLLSGRPVAEEWYERPQFYFSNPGVMVGHGGAVAVPPGCERLDLELEVAAIIGRGGRDLTTASARACIAGYAVLNDWSARDLQFGEMPVGLGPAKGKDFATSLGPWIVTADELEAHRAGDRLALEMTARVNGEELGGDSLANMGWSFEEMAVHASRGAPLRPGDVLGSGTCGAGCLAELWGRHGAITPPPLRAGDVVSLEVEALGTLTNPIVAATAEPVPMPRARRAERRPRPWAAGV